MLLPTDLANGGEETMGTKRAYACASERACALVRAASYKSRFYMVPLHGMHADRDGNGDRLADVTAESTDVSNRRQQLEGSGLTCQSAPTCHSTHNTASAVLCAKRSEDRCPVRWCNLQASKRSKPSAVARHVQGSVWTSQRVGEQI